MSELSGRSQLLLWCYSTCHYANALVVCVQCAFPRPSFSYSEALSFDGKQVTLAVGPSRGSFLVCCQALSCCIVNLHRQLYPALLLLHPFLLPPNLAPETAQRQFNGQHPQHLPQPPPTKQDTFPTPVVDLQGSLHSASIFFNSAGTI